MALFYFAWPILKQRRSYVVAAAILCFAPSVVDRAYPIAVWPLILCLPSHLQSVELSLDFLCRFVNLYLFLLPMASVVGMIAWWLYGRLRVRLRFHR